MYKLGLILVAVVALAGCDNAAKVDLCDVWFYTVDDTGETINCPTDQGSPLNHTAAGTGEIDCALVLNQCELEQE